MDTDRCEQGVAHVVITPVSGLANCRGRTARDRVVRTNSKLISEAEAGAAPLVLSASAEPMSSLVADQRTVMSSRHRVLAINIPGAH